MSTSQLLDYEILLLLAKHGKERILTALADKLHLTMDELQCRLEELKLIQPKHGRRKQLDPEEFLDGLLKRYPSKSENLKLLYTRYDSKAFLPELRDVRAFLDRHSSNPAPVKSRMEALPQLFELLACFDSTFLAVLCQPPESRAHSDLAVIADAILGRSG